MRHVILISVAAAFVATAIGPGTAQAQQWIEYVNRDLRFSINFPHQPREEEIAYTTRYDATVPAYVFSAEQNTGRYVITVVDYSGQPTDTHTAISHAVQVLREKGEVTYDAFANLDGIPGQQLSLTGPDRRLVQAIVYMFADMLYIAEGSVAAGNPAPSQFQQTISIIDAQGNRIVLDGED